MRVRITRGLLYDVRQRSSFAPSHAHEGATRPWHWHPSRRFIAHYQGGTRPRGILLF